MNRTTIATLLGVALGAVAFSGAAEAKGPHCAGGIQYVVLAMHDKDKGNIDDYKREIQKAVVQLEQCAAEEPKEYESIGYLGWAYAEVDSMRLAGQAFDKAIAGLATIDAKKVSWATNNRDSYWATAFNSGITKINDAQAAYPIFLKAAENDADKTLKEEARKKYEEAELNLRRANQLKPTDAKTLRNLGSVYAFMGNWMDAEAIFLKGLQVAPGDSDLVNSLISVRTQRAGALIDEKKYDEAILFYIELAKGDPGNSDLQLGLAEAYFKRAQSKEGDTRKPDFKLAGDAYAKAGQLKTTNADLPFNAALAYQNAGETALAEGQWKATIKIRPDDSDAMSALGSTLSDLKKFDEAAAVLRGALDKNPKNKIFHRQLGAVYTKAGNNAKGTEEFLVYLSLANGTVVGDPAAQAKKAPASSAAGKTLASLSAPDQINVWDADGQHYETWYYWTKKVAFHFSPEGAQLQKSDWGAAVPVSGTKK